MTKCIVSDSYMNFTELISWNMLWNMQEYRNGENTEQLRSININEMQIRKRTIKGAEA